MLLLYFNNLINKHYKHFIKQSFFIWYVTLDAQAKIKVDINTIILNSVNLYI